jgi:hypothetical protein
MVNSLTVRKISFHHFTQGLADYHVGPFGAPDFAAFARIKMILAGGALNDFSGLGDPVPFGRSLVRF